ncbi:MAG: tRNA (adenosine(37)-N6)-threonylcarbamoyltransferase complex transferase subunit TsaD [Candidatus Omnitrophota bacterium]|nr:MAG: tRNA (adenosine(37)-N6)-threonylcarbamoyltransferase complex transferase subunit TsaD [Candidatus Omnitrophota bacterium]
MYTLGIETSCDETSVAIVNRRKVLSCETASSLNFHKKYGGIIPEIASRKHLKFIGKVTQSSLRKANIELKKIKLVSVTQGPGLIGSLLVGVSFAKALAFSLGIPLLGVNHLFAHLFSPFLNRRKLNFPFIGLVASGGHTEIYRVSDFDRIKVLGKTKDDAAGEVLDKVGRFYGLGYPAGPAIDKLFQEELVDKSLFRLKKKEDLSFSFSGIKTRAIYIYQELNKTKKIKALDKKIILSSLQYTLINSLINNLTKALIENKISIGVCGGGVVANSYFRKVISRIAKKRGFKIFLPEINYCQDNAASVAGIGEYLYQKGYKSSYQLTPF